MKEQIEEAFEYLQNHPGVLTFSERALIERYKRIYQDRQTLSEAEKESLFQLRDHRERCENSIKG
jgi:hypothetical protein